MASVVLCVVGLVETYSQSDELIRVAGHTEKVSLTAGEQLQHRDKPGTMRQPLRFRLPILLLGFAVIAVPLAVRTVIIRRHLSAYQRLQQLEPSRSVTMSEVYTDVVGPRIIRGGPHPTGYPAWMVRMLGYQGVRRVACYGAEIKDDEAALLGSMLHVNFIELFGTRITRKGLTELPQSITHLQLIGPNEDPQLLEGLRSLPQLQTLSIANISAADVDLSFLADFPGLRHLVLWNTDITEQQSEWLRERLPHATIELFNKPKLDLQAALHRAS